MHNLQLAIDLMYSLIALGTITNNFLPSGLIEHHIFSFVQCIYSSIEARPFYKCRNCWWLETKQTTSNQPLATTPTKEPTTKKKLIKKMFVEKPKKRTSQRIQLEKMEKTRIANETLKASGVEITPKVIELESDSPSQESQEQLHLVECQDDSPQPKYIKLRRKGPEEKKTKTPSTQRRTILNKLRRKETDTSDQTLPPKSKKQRQDMSGIEAENQMVVAKKTKKKYHRSHRLTRHAPILLTEVMNSLSEKQKKWVRATGLGGLLDFKMEKYDHKLLNILVSNFNALESEIAFPCGTIPVNEEDVEEILGLPRGKSPLMFGKFGESTENEHLFRQNFPEAKRPCDIGLIELCDRAKEMEEASHIFKLFFLVIVNNMLIKKNTNMYANQAVLRFKGNIDKLNNYNWCAYLLDTLKAEKAEWAKLPDKKLYNGSLAFFTLLYVQRTHLKGLPPNRSNKSTTLQKWTEETLSIRFNDELKRGPFGTDIVIVGRPVLEKKRRIEEMILEDEQQDEQQEQEVKPISTINEADWGMVSIEKGDMVAKLRQCADDVLTKLSELKEAKRRFNETLVTCEIGDQRVNDIVATVIHEF